MYILVSDEIHGSDCFLRRKNMKKILSHFSLIQSYIIFLKFQIFLLWQ